MRSVGTDDCVLGEYDVINSACEEGTKSSGRRGSKSRRQLRHLRPDRTYDRTHPVLLLYMRFKPTPSRGVSRTYNQRRTPDRTSPSRAILLGGASWTSANIYPTTMMTTLAVVE